MSIELENGKDISSGLKFILFCLVKNMPSRLLLMGLGSFGSNSLCLDPEGLLLGLVHTNGVGA